MTGVYTSSFVRLISRTSSPSTFGSFKSRSRRPVCWVPARHSYCGAEDSSGLPPPELAAYERGKRQFNVVRVVFNRKDRLQHGVWSASSILTRQRQKERGAFAPVALVTFGDAAEIGKPDARAFKHLLVVQPTPNRFPA